MNVGEIPLIPTANFLRRLLRRRPLLRRCLRGEGVGEGRHPLSLSLPLSLLRLMLLLPSRPPGRCSCSRRGFLQTIRRRPFRWGSAPARPPDRRSRSCHHCGPRGRVRQRWHPLRRRHGLSPPRTVPRALVTVTEGAAAVSVVAVSAAGTGAVNAAGAGAAGSGAAAMGSAATFGFACCMVYCAIPNSVQVTLAPQATEGPLPQK